MLAYLNCDRYSTIHLVAYDLTAHQNIYIKLVRSKCWISCVWDYAQANTGLNCKCIVLINSFVKFFEQFFMIRILHSDAYILKQY